MAEVGGVRSSADPAPDLWFGENAEERRDATCSAAGRATKDMVTASSEAISAQNNPRVVNPGWRVGFTVTPAAKGTRKAGCGKTARPV